MSYGKVMGRLVIARRGKPRKGTISGNCRWCKKPVEQNTVHLLLLRTIAIKKTGKIVWTTRRFHTHCFPDWLNLAISNLPEVEAKAAKRRTGRPRIILSVLSAEELVTRNVMQKRRSYLINRLLRNPQYNQETREEVEEEIRCLALSIDAIAPSNRFATKKRKARSEHYHSVTQTTPDLTPRDSDRIFKSVHLYAPPTGEAQ